MFKKVLLALALAGFCVSVFADTQTAQYGVAYTAPFKLFNADGSLDVDEVDGGAEVSVRCPGGANTTATNDFVDRGSDYEITLTAAEMSCSTVIVTIAATTTEVIYINTVNNSSASIPLFNADVREWNDAVVATPNLAGVPKIDVTTWYGSDLLTGTGPLPGLGVIDRGTAQSDYASTLQLRSALTFADDELIGKTAVIYSATTGAGQSGTFSDYAGATDTGTFTSPLITDPTGTVRYEIYGTASGSGGGGGGATAAEVWGYGDRRLTNFDEDSMTIDINNTAIGSVVGSVASVTGNVQGSVVGSVASVTGNVAGNVDGSVGSVAAGGITAASIATGAIDADAVATDAVDKIWSSIIEDQGAVSARCAASIFLAALAGDVTTSAGSSTFRDPSGVEVRISSTQSASSRSVTITCPTY